jgi:hypothetical protein
MACPCLLLLKLFPTGLVSLGSPELDLCGYGCGPHRSFLFLLWRVVFGSGMQGLNPE